MILQLLIIALLVGFGSSVNAAQVCLDRDEFTGLIQRVEQYEKATKLSDIRAGLYKQANDARKEELRVSDDLHLSKDRYIELSDELLRSTEELRQQKDAEHAKELADLRWWRNAGWGTAVAVAVGAVILGVLK